MATKAEMISDLELRLTRGKPSDDLELEQDQISHWIDSVRDAVVAQKIADDAKKGIPPAGIYITYEEGLLASPISGQVQNTGRAVRYSIDVTKPILDIDGDTGLRVMREIGGEWVNLYSPDECEVLQHLRFAQPQSDYSNLNGYRENQKIVIFGIDTTDVANQYYSVFFIERTPSKTLSDTDTYPLEAELVPLVLDQAEEIGRRQMGMDMFEDLDNDGIQYEEVDGQ